MNYVIASLCWRSFLKIDESSILVKARKVETTLAAAMVTQVKEAMTHICKQANTKVEMAMCERCTREELASEGSRHYTFTLMRPS